MPYRRPTTAQSFLRLLSLIVAALIVACSGASPVTGCSLASCRAPWGIAESHAGALSAKGSNSQRGKLSCCGGTDTG